MEEPELGVSGYNGDLGWDIPCKAADAVDS